MAEKRVCAFLWDSEKTGWSKIIWRICRREQISFELNMNVHGGEDRDLLCSSELVRTTLRLTNLLSNSYKLLPGLLLSALSWCLTYINYVKKASKPYYFPFYTRRELWSRGWSSSTCLNHPNPHPPLNVNFLPLIWWSNMELTFFI